MTLRSVGTVKDTTTITIRHPDFTQKLTNPDGSPMTVEMYGPFSKHYKKTLRKLQQARVLSKTLEEDDAVDAMQRDLALGCIKSWDLTLDGEERLPLTDDNLALVANECPWLVEQLVLAQGISSSFLEQPKKT